MISSIALYVSRATLYQELGFIEMGSFSLATLAMLTLWIAGLLCLLNVVLAVFFRKRQRKEVLSYLLACAVELSIFVTAILILLKIIVHVPYHLPPGLPVNRAEIGAALAFGIGLFPAAYWHRINLSELPKRIADDAQALKDHDSGVRIRNSAPGEWMN